MERYRRQGCADRGPDRGQRFRCGARTRRTRRVPRVDPPHPSMNAGILRRATDAQGVRDGAPTGAWRDCARQPLPGGRAQTSDPKVSGLKRSSQRSSRPGNRPDQRAARETARRGSGLLGTTLPEHGWDPQSAEAGGEMVGGLPATSASSPQRPGMHFGPDDFLACRGERCIIPGLSRSGRRGSNPRPRAWEARASVGRGGTSGYVVPANGEVRRLGAALKYPPGPYTGCTEVARRRRVALQPSGAAPRQTADPVAHEGQDSACAHHPTGVDRATHRPPPVRAALRVPDTRRTR